METFDGEDIAEADIVEDADDVVWEETNVTEETPALLAPLTVTVNEETNTEITEDVVSFPVAVPSAVEALRALMDTPVVVKPLSAVDALRAMLDSAAVEVPEVPLTGVAALAAMLATATPVAETVKPVRVRKASKGGIVKTCGSACHATC